MNKEEAIKNIIKTIYNNNSNLIMTENEVKKLNNFFKSSLVFDKDFDNYFEENISELDGISKLKSGKYEMEKQYNQNKALQPGIISECNYVETLARIFKLNKCLDFDRTPMNKVPIECRCFLNSGYQTFSAARYLYYNPKKTDLFIFQYGNPANGDAEIIMNGNKIRLEFKERNAKAGEYDITGLYDESGKLLISDDFRSNTPEYVPFINKFNEETNVIEQIGHNYNNFDEDTKITSIVEYFIRHNIDIIISSTPDNELIALTPDCIHVVSPSGKRIITTDNSEIRTSGRNHKKIFTKKYFNRVLEMMNAKRINDSEYQVSLDNQYVEIVNGRGTNVPSRVKFNKIFYVDIRKSKIDNNILTFNINSVEQLKPSISMHLKINATKDELRKYFENKYNEVI